jgi:hypothetical protein
MIAIRPQAVEPRDGDLRSLDCACLIEDATMKLKTHVPLGFARAVGAAAAGSSGQKWRG